MAEPVSGGFAVIIAIAGAMFGLLHQFDNDKSCMLAAKAFAFRTAGVKVDYIGCCPVAETDSDKCQTLIGPQNFHPERKKQEEPDDGEDG